MNMDASNCIPIQNPTRSLHRRFVFFILAAMFLATVTPVRSQVKSDKQKKVLVLELMRRNDTSTLTIDRTYQQVLNEGLAGQLDYYSETVDLARFGGDDYQGALRDFFRQKYNGINFDLIVATTADLKNFLVRYGAEIFPNTPVVFSASDDVLENNPATPPNFTGIGYETNLRGTLDVIRRLQPDVRRVIVVSGSSKAVDQWHEARARRQFKDFSGPLEFTYWNGLAMGELKRRLSTLTPDTVVYFIMFTEDAAGERFTATSVLDQISAVTSVPIYTWYDGYLGHGVVGGRLASTENVASQTARVALRILHGEHFETTPLLWTDTSRLAFDWHELQRWKLPEDRLPVDAEVLFREPTFWQRYKNRIIGVIGVFAVQSLLIVALLIERRRRRKAIIGLRVSEERYRNVVEAQTELICRFLPDTTLTFVNEAYCKYFGKAAKELIGTKYIDLIPESERRSMLRYVESLIQHPRSDTREHPVIRPGRAPGWHQWTSCVISSSDKIELQGVGRDISERKRLEQQLVQSEREFSTLVENSPDVITRLDHNLRYIYVSPNFKGIFGISPEMCLGMRPSEVPIPNYDWNEFEGKCREAIEKRQLTVFEFQYNERHYRTRVIPEFVSSGRVESVMSINEDFTERLRAELELREVSTRLLTLQDQERRRIARELHDGATQNIVAISMDLARLQEIIVNPIPETKELLDECRQIAEESLNELRTISYLLHPPVLDRSGLERALQWFVKGFSERSGIQVDTTAIQDIGRLPGDIETALFRVVQESLTNVRRHSGSNTASIRLEKGSGGVKLQISDCGHGMPVSESPANESNGKNVEMGVGIPGMRERMKQLGGRLEIESSKNGTTITVVVPELQIQALSLRSGAARA